MRRVHFLLSAYTVHAGVYENILGLSMCSPINTLLVFEPDLNKCIHITNTENLFLILT